MYPMFECGFALWSEAEFILADAESGDGLGVWDTGLPLGLGPVVEQTGVG